MLDRVRRGCLRGEAVAIALVVRGADRWAGPWQRRRRLSPYALYVVEGLLSGADVESAVAAARRLSAPGDGPLSVGRRQRAARRPHEVLAARPPR